MRKWCFFILLLDKLIIFKEKVHHFFRHTLHVLYATYHAKDPASRRKQVHKLLTYP